MSFETVLLPTDGSEGTERATDLAMELAAADRATLYVLYVVDEAAIPLDSRVRSLLDTFEQRGKEAVDRVAARAEDEGIESVTTEIREGRPHRAIVDYADEADVDLIVMGTHGRRGLERYLLGSVTEKVVRTSDVPVLTARIDEARAG